jgi:hypothetical protein
MKALRANLRREARTTVSKIPSDAPNPQNVGLARVSGLGPVESEGSRLLRARFTRLFLRSAR